MQTPGRIISYSLLILILGIILKTVGLFNTNMSVLVSFVLVFSGVGFFANFFGSHRPFMLTISTLIFYSGFMLLLKTYFSFEIRIFSFLPNLLLICGLNFLLLFVENRSKKAFLLFAIVFSAVAVGLSKIFGVMNFANVLYYFVEIIRSFWFFIVLLLIIVLFYVIRTESK